MDIVGLRNTQRHVRKHLGEKVNKTIDFNGSDGTIGSEALDGGKGSGNWGHAGRPGHRGGSASRGGMVLSEPTVAATGSTRPPQSERLKTVHKTEDSDAFKGSLTEAKNSLDARVNWRVDDYSHSKEDYDKCTKLVSDGGSTVAVAPNGNIISVCKHDGDICSGSDMLKAAVEAGGDRLDAFGESLFDFYTKNGFEPVSWTPFNKEYAPPGWTEGIDEEEPILFYKYSGKKTTVSYNDFLHNVKPSVDKIVNGKAVEYGYDLAENLRDKEMGG